MNENNIVMWELLQSNADWVCFRTDFAGGLEDSKSTTGGTFCVFGSHTLVPISWMCKKHQFLSAQQNLKIISLDTGLRLDGLPSFAL